MSLPTHHFSDCDRLLRWDCTAHTCKFKALPVEPCSVVCCSPAALQWHPAVELPLWLPYHAARSEYP